MMERKDGGRRRGMRGRPPSSQRWLRRQFSDPFVARATREGYRSRSAYKLIGIDDRRHLLRRGMRVLDLGAAPGGWTQVAVERVGPGRTVALDLRPMQPIEGALFLEADAFAEGTGALAREALGGPADVVLSDMAPNATGHRATDQLRSITLAEAALDLARSLLRPGGSFLVKIIRGGGEEELAAAIRTAFGDLRREKPAASRKESREVFLLAREFRGGT